MDMKTTDKLWGDFCNVVIETHTTSLPTVEARVAAHLKELREVMTKIHEKLKGTCVRKLGCLDCAAREVLNKTPGDYDER